MPIAEQVSPMSVRNGSVLDFPTAKASRADTMPFAVKSQGILLQSRSPCGLILLVQEGHTMTDSNDFCISGSGIVVKLNQVTNIHGQESKILTVQVILIQPEQDILQVRVKTENQHIQSPSLCKLSSDSKSLILELRPRRKIDLDGNGTIYRSYVFSLEVFNCPWNQSFQSIAVANSDITVKCDGNEIHTLKQHLMKSPVLKEKLATAGSTALEIDNHSFPVVQEMIRFLTHGYCCLWDSPDRKNLVRIAQEFKIDGMKTLADQKRTLIL